SRRHLLAGLAVVGHEVHGARFAHAFALEVHDGTVEFQAVEADLYFATAEVAWGFEAGVLEREGVVGEHGAILLDEEQFLVDVARREEADAAEIEPEAIDGFHAER